MLCGMDESAVFGPGAVRVGISEWWSIRNLTLKGEDGRTVP